MDFLAIILPKLRYTVFAYSQEGEDLILKRIFYGKKNGIYIDIGSHHPFRFSNTYLFYKKKWTGVNIEPRPGTKYLFDKYRPRDINLELGVSMSRQKLTYYMFSEPAINTFSKEQADIWIDEKHKLITTLQIETYPLSDILEQYLPAHVKKIDFLTIDVEGMDLDVLKSNNWTKFRPEYILVECHNASIKNISTNETYKFMQSVGYELFAKTYYTYFYKTAQS